MHGCHLDQPQLDVWYGGVLLEAGRQLRTGFAGLWALRRASLAIRVTVGIWIILVPTVEKPRLRLPDLLLGAMGMRREGRLTASQHVFMGTWQRATDFNHIVNCKILAR